MNALIVTLVLYTGTILWIDHPSMIRYLRTLMQQSISTSRPPKPATARERIQAALQEHQEDEQKYVAGDVMIPVDPDNRMATTCPGGTWEVYEPGDERYPSVKRCRSINTRTARATVVDLASNIADESSASCSTCV